jgi:hypothetical protein
MLQRIIAEKPDQFMMASGWREAGKLPNLDASLRRTVQELQKAGIAVMLIGDAPLYYSDIPRVQQMMRQHGANDEWQVPASKIWADPTIRKIAAGYRLPFFSPVEF